jgi:hypothetical protein
MSPVISSKFRFSASPELVAGYLPSVVTNGAIGIISFHNDFLENHLEDFFVGWRGSIKDGVELLKCRVWTADRILRENQQDFHPAWPGVNPTPATAGHVEQSLRTFAFGDAFGGPSIDLPRVVLFDWDEIVLQRKSAIPSTRDGHYNLRIRVSVSQVTFIGRTAFQLKVDGDWERETSPVDEDWI